MHQPQAYVAQNPVEYIAVQNCHKYAPARTLPSAPTLPSTPAMSRPGSAGSSVVILASPRPSSQRVAPQDFNLVMNGKEVAGTVGLDRTLLTPTTPPLSTESSRWGTPMADPMLSGLDAGASKPGPVYTQAEPQGKCFVEALLHSSLRGLFSGMSGRQDRHPELKFNKPSQQGRSKGTGS